MTKKQDARVAALRSDGEAAEKQAAEKATLVAELDGVL